jgi:sugar fermentation stimulation protein A
VRARFVERPNRFLLRVVRVDSDSEEIEEAHLPDPGRLRELLIPGAEIWLRPADGPTRRTRWTAMLVRSPDGSELISLDTTLPNRLLAPALGSRLLEEFEDWSLEAREWTHGRSRFDFLLVRESGERLVLEVKSVTLVEGRTALFPDAVTSRGARHVRELAEFAGRSGWNAAVLFVAQRADADRILPAREIDPDFADALLEARDAGVQIFGRRSRVDHDSVTLGSPVEVLLPDP